MVAGIHRGSAVKPTEKKKTTPPVDEVVIDPIRNLYREYPADTITPRSLRDILRRADAGYTTTLMTLLDDVSNDAHVGSQLRARKLSVAGADWKCDAGEESDTGRAIAEEATAFLKRIPNFQQLKMDVLDDFFRGFSCVQPIWEGVGGRWDVTRWKSIESRHFQFKDGVEPRILTDLSSDGEPLHEGLIYSECRDKPGPVVRGSVGRQIVKLWLYKSFAYITCMSYLERFGHPTVTAEVPKHIRESTAEMERIKSTLKAFVNDMVGIVPEGTKIAIHESLQKAATVRDMYLVFCEAMDAGISKAITGGTLTSDAARSGGLGHGQEAKQHGDTKQETREADADRLSEVISQQLLKPWTLYHYGPAALPPRFCIDVEEPEDKLETAQSQKYRAETLSILSAAGLRIKQSQVYEEFDLEEPSPMDKVLDKPPAQPPSNIPGTEVA